MASLPKYVEEVEDDFYSEFATKAIHVGQDPDQWDSLAVVPAISVSATYKLGPPGKTPYYIYGRHGTPSRAVLEECLSSLENAKHTLTFSSGVAAISAIVHLLHAGDHIISCYDIFGGTTKLLRNIITKMDVKTSFVDTTDLKTVEKTIQKNTKMLFLEALTNPLLLVNDIKALSDLAHRYNILVVVDNTFLTPYFYRPIDSGVDIVMHSATKYLNGHSDVIMGVVSTNSDDLYKELKDCQNLMGSIPSPFDCFLVNRSLKTLNLRMRQHEKNAMAVARFLEAHPLVRRVKYPGLPSHPQHELAKRQFKGFSGMISFYIDGGIEESQTVIRSLKTITYAGSLGGYHSLVEIPAILSHAALTQQEREKFEITDDMIRLSVGLESVRDLIADLDQALNATKKCSQNDVTKIQKDITEFNIY